MIILLYSYLLEVIVKLIQSIKTFYKRARVCVLRIFDSNKQNGIYWSLIFR